MVFVLKIPQILKILILTVAILSELELNELKNLQNNKKLKDNTSQFCIFSKFIKFEIGHHR